MKTVKRWLSGLMGIEGATTSEAHRRARHTPARLSAVAGSSRRADRHADTGTELMDSMIERLESRQLMFQVVVTDGSIPAQPGVQLISSANGYATIQVDFGYLVPFLFSSTVPPPQTTDPTASSDLNARDIVGGQQNYNFDDFTIPNNDGLRFQATSGTSLDIIQTPGSSPDAQERSARFRLGPNGTFVLYFPATTSAEAFLPLAQFQFATLIGPANFANLEADLLQVPFTVGTGTAFLQDITTNDVNLTGAKVTLSGLAGDLNTLSFNASSFAQPPKYFNVLRFRNISNVSTVSLTVDDFVATPYLTRFATFHAARQFGASIRVTAPIGAQVEVLDLYGRQMQASLDVASVAGLPISPVDIDDNGVPDFNDGIGRISITGADSRTRVSLVGFKYSFDTATRSYTRTLPTSLTGLQADFLNAGFGYQLNVNGTTLTVAGLPPASGSVIVGSPFIRDNRSTASYYGLSAALAGGPSNSALVSFSNLVLANNLANLPNIPVIKQGISADSTIGSLELSATVHGVISVAGSIGRLGVSYLPGSIAVDGDAGAILIASDTGLFVNNPPNTNIVSDLMFNTGSTITVGRFLNQVHVGGRSAANVQVLGDLNNANRPPQDFLQYGELENIFGFATSTDATQVLYALGLNANDSSNVFTSGLNQFYFGGGLFRNDSINSSEFIGSGIRGAVITGELGTANPVESAEDAADVYGFAAQKGRQVSFNIATLARSQGFSASLYARVVDSEGRTLASYQYPPLTNGIALPTSGGAAGFPDARFVFTPKGDDVYYLVVGVPTDGFVGTSLQYQVTMTGQANNTLGMYSAAAGSRYNTITVLNGSTGLIREGAGLSNATGVNTAETPGGIVTVESPQDLFSSRGVSYSLAGNLFGYLSGSDVGFNLVPPSSGFITNPNQVTFPTNLTVGGDLGSFRTGHLVGYTFGADGRASSTSGDINLFTLKVGGSIGIFDVAGGVAYQTTATPLKGAGPTGSVVINTGTTGAPGHIGQFLVGNVLIGQAFTLKTSANSEIGRFVVGTQPAGTGGQNTSPIGIIGLFQPSLQLGAGSNIRFADFSQIAVGTNGAPITNDFFVDIVAGTPLNLTDDNGTPFTISITGGRGNAAIGSRARIRYMPVNGSTGVVVARIDAALLGGANLVITGTGPGTVDIGRISIATDTPTGNQSPSNVIIQGTTRINVYEIDSDTTLGATLAAGILVNNTAAATASVLGDIRNSTPGGDIIAIDVLSLRTLTVSGNLGRTNVQGIGTDLIGPFRGLTVGGTGGGSNNTAGSAIPVEGGVLTQGVTDVFVPVGDTGVGGFLEDIGSPLSPWLNGLLVRTGPVRSVSVNGAVGDVILVGGTGSGGGGGGGGGGGNQIFENPAILQNLVVNADGRTTPGSFDGIVGHIYAFTIGRIDVGDGLRGPGEGPFAEAGIFAVDDIGTVVGGSRVKNPVINGIIIAGNQFISVSALATPGFTRVTFDTQGIGEINFSSGTVDGAFIGACTLDSWWRSTRETPFVGAGGQSDAPTASSLGLGLVNRVILSNTSLVRSTVFGGNIRTVQITKGNFDASTVQAQFGNVTLVTADNFINSTRDGEPLEYHYAQIRVAGDLANVRTTNKTGTISDLFINVNGDLTGAITAFDITRLTLEANKSVNMVAAGNDLRSSTVNAGRLNSITAGNNIRSTTVSVAGAIQTITAKNDITQAQFIANGTGGQIGKITAGGSFSGQITTSGVFAALTATKGDLSGNIIANEADANILAIKAGRDVNLSIFSAAGIGTITAGRHVGRRLLDGITPDAIEIAGNLGSVTAGGQIYADLKVGQSITGAIKIGRVAALPNATAGTDRDRVSDATIIAAGRIASIAITGDFAGSIIAYSGGIGKVAITAGSFRRYAPNVQTADPSLVNSITAFDGDIDSISITRGHLLGDVKALNGSIKAISIKGDSNFGDIGIDPTKVVAPNNPSPADVALSTSEQRFRLPALPTGAFGAGQDGPTIFAKYDIVNLTTTGGIYEAVISAGRSILSLTAGGTDNTGPATTTPTAIIAGDSIARATFGAKGATTVTRGLFIGAGVTSLGADNLAGGTGINADTVESGDIGDITFNGNIVDTKVTAGLNAGADGLYNTADDLAAPGLSTIKTVKATGSATNSSAFAHTNTGVVTPATIAVGGPALASADARVFTGSTAGFTAITAAGANFNVNGQTVNIRLTGPGQAFFDDTTNPGTVRIILLGTTSASQLAFVGAVGVTTLNNLQIVSGLSASLQSLSLPLALTGNSAMYVDGTIGTLTLGNVSTPAGSPGIFQAGQGITTAIIGAVGNSTPNTLRLVTNVLGTATFNGGLGDSSLSGATSNLSRLDAKLATAVNINGDHAGVISIERDLGTLRITGAVDEAGVRVGGSLNAFTSGSLFRARVAARSALGTVGVSGNVTDSFFYAGTDLGLDAAIGGTGLNADSTGNANIRSIAISGDFTGSDIAAGVRRGVGSFLTQTNDRSADGRSVIGSVTIGGQAVGSAFNSQAFGIVSNGTLGPVLVGGQSFAGAGNLKVLALANQPASLRVLDLRVDQEAGVYFARIRFSQALDFSSVAAALSIFEVRGSGPTATLSSRLNGPNGVGTDYALTYDQATNTVTVEFSPVITQRVLTNNAPGADTPQTDGLGNPIASPGLYEFAIDASLLRAQAIQQQLDGNGDGVSGDDYTGFDVVGDAGDRLSPQTADAGFGATAPLYGPVDINPLFGGLESGVPKINSEVTIRGILGDHAYHNPLTFDIGSDLDLYSITLKAGQIVQLGAVTGVASLATTELFQVDPNTGSPVSGGLQLLPVQVNSDITTLGQKSYLITEGGTFAIIVSSLAANNAAFSNDPSTNQPFISGSTLINLPPAAGEIGTYAFTVGLLDSGSAGFAAGADANAPAPIGSVPVPADFLAPGDTISVAATVGPNFVYRLRTMRDGNQVVVGTNGDGVNSTRTAGADGIFGTGDDIVNLTSDSGDGTDIVASPKPSEFAGADNTLGTLDDIASITRDGFRWVLTPGANGVLNGNGTSGNKSDDAVVGTDRFGNTLTQTPGPDGIFDTNDDLTSVGGSNGRPVTAGTPSKLVPDVHIYNLNGNAAIAANSRYRITLRVAQNGDNLGLLAPRTVDIGGINTFGITDLRGLVQFGVFDRTESVAIDDANLVLAPDKVGGIAGQANRLISADPQTRYGFDERGDYYIEFTLPPSLANVNSAGNYAVYLQAAVNSNFQVDIQRLNNSAPVVAPKTQNVFIETRGGFVDWLEANRRTAIESWNPEVNGFSGRINNISARDYILGDANNTNPNNLIALLNAIFSGVPGADSSTVRFSTNPADFEGQEFSTIFLSNRFEPSAFYNNTSAFNLNFGAIQGVDPFNSNHRDQGVIFMQALNLLGNLPTQSGADRFTRQLAGAVAREVAQLIGLRITQGTGSGPFVDPTNDYSPILPPTAGGVYQFNSFSSALNPTTASGNTVFNTGTQFFLGRQISETLLQRIFNLV